MGYFYGYSFGNMLRDGGSADVDLESLLVGLKDALDGKDPKLTSKQQQVVYVEITKRQQQMQAKKIAEEQLAAETNLAQAESFLKQNSTAEGVVTTASGLQYLVLHDEPGETAKVSDHVVVNYRGSLQNGQVFDESRSPVEFGLSQVIAGWTEGLQLMSAGDKFRLFIHPALAYGPGGTGSIPGNSLLLFDVELLEIKSVDNHAH